MIRPANNPPAQVNVHEAKTHFSKLLARVQNGEEIVIAKAGKPVARLLPATPPPALPPRVPGTGKGLGMIMDNFDDPLPQDILDEFYK